MNGKEILKRKTILIVLSILLLLIAALIAVGITIAAGNTTEPETEQTFTEEGDGYYIWVRAVDHAGNKGPWSEAQRVWIETGKPTITLKSNSSTTWAQTVSVTVALQDSKSGLAEGASVKYGWSESLDTAPSSYTDASLNYTAGTKEEVTFTASASGLTGKYYLWVVPTTLADKAGNSQTATVKSTGQFYFDNEKPKLSATNTVNGSAYSGAWTAGPVTTALTFSDDKSGIDADSLAWKETGTDWKSESNTSTTSYIGSWSANRSSTGYYRIYDNAGNYNEVSFALNIDSNSPTVKANNSSVTITKGQNYAMSSYFTTSANGSAGISSTTYKIGSTSYSNTSSLAAGTYTVTCTVTKVTGKTASASMTLKVTSLPVSDTQLSHISKTGGGWSTDITIPSEVKILKIVTSGGGLTGSLYDYDQAKIVQFTTNGTWYVSVVPGRRYKFYLYHDTDYTTGPAHIYAYYSETINGKNATKSWTWVD